MKDWKTTVLGVLSGIITLLLAFGQITSEDAVTLQNTSPTLIAAIATLIGVFAKDSDAAKVIVITLISTALIVSEKRQTTEIQTFEAIENKHVEFGLFAAA